MAIRESEDNGGLNEPQIHFDDGRYPRWRQVYDVLLAAIPPELRVVLKPSLGTLSSRLIHELYPFEGKAERSSETVDRKLEQIIENLTAVGQIWAKDGKGSLNPLEFEALKLAQEALGLLRQVKT